MISIFVLSSLLALATAQTTCGKPEVSGKQCNSHEACACTQTECALKPCYLPPGTTFQATATAEDSKLCAVNSESATLITSADSNKGIALRTNGLRLVKGSLHGNSGMLGIELRIKSNGCSQAELTELASVAAFQSDNGVYVVKAGRFTSVSKTAQSNETCNSWTGPNAAAAALREAALDKQCPFRKRDCSEPSSGTGSSTQGSTIVELTLSSDATTTSTTKADVTPASDSSGTAGATSGVSQSRDDTEPSSSSSMAMSSAALCAAAATVAAMNPRAPWHVPAVAGVAGFFAMAHAAPASTCDVWIELLATTNGAFVSFIEATNGTDTTVRFAVAVPGRPFVTGDGDAVLTAITNDSKTASPSAIGSHSCSLLTTELIEAASAELSASATEADEEAWLMQASAEHASVASFAQFTLNLMANAAPSPLLAASLRAAQDEVLHADASLAMARAMSSKNVAFDKFPARAIDGMRAQSLEELAVATLREGGVAELVSTLEAVIHVGEAYQRGQEHVAGVWRAIATDETRHALLAWRTLAWTMRSNPELKAVLANELTEVARLTASSSLHVGAMKQLILPLFDLVQTSDLPDSVDHDVSAALKAVELASFDVDAVLNIILSSVRK